MTQLELQQEINNSQPIEFPGLQAFGLNSNEIVIAAYGMKGMLRWKITGGKISTIRGLRTKAFCVKVEPEEDYSFLTVEDEANNILTFNLPHLRH